MSPRVEFLGIADGPTFETRSVGSLTLTFEGIPGDRHAGLVAPAGVRQKHVARGTPIRNARQLSIVSVEELARIAQALSLGRLEPQWLGANLMISGLNSLTQLAPSTRLKCSSGAIIVIDGDNDPCTSAGGAVERATGVIGVRSAFPKAAMGLRGLVGWVEREGVVSVGDTVTLVER